MSAPSVTVENNNRKVIRVFPDLQAGAFSGTAGDVLCTNVEIPNAVIGSGGCSRLENTYTIDYKDIQSQEDFWVIFHQHNAAVFGSVDATADISVADLKSNKVLGMKLWDNDAAETSTHVDNAVITELIGATSSSEQAMPIYLQAEDTSTSVYFSVIMKASTTGIDWDTGDLEFIFHIQY